MEGYERLPICPTIGDFYTLLENWLTKCLVLKKKCDGIYACEDDNTISSLNSNCDINAFFDNWFKKSNINLSKAFSLTNHLLKCQSLENDSKLKSITVNRSPSTIENWKILNEKLGTAVPHSKTLHNQYCRAIKWWSKSFKFDNFEHFTLKELDKVFKFLNKKSVGTDKVPFCFMPFLKDHKAKLLFAINKSVFSTSKFDKKFLQSRVIFIDKSNGKKRPLCIINRLACIVEKLVSNRLMEIIVKAKCLDNRYGFIEGRNVESLQIDLFMKIWEMKFEKRKTAIISYDLSCAYDMTNHMKLVIKVKKFIQRHVGLKDIKRYSIIFGFCYRWLQNRYVRLDGYKSWSFKMERGLPQGSPFSCLLFTIYYNFRSSEHEYFYADDTNVLVSGDSWKNVETKILKINADFKLWCLNNDMQVNLNKTNIC